MPQNSRIWIFSSAKPLTGALAEELESRIMQFVDGWTSHGAALKAAMAIVDEHFIVLAADESQVNASGCSIDKVYQFIQILEKEYTLNLLDRMLVVYYEGDLRKAIPLHQFWAMRKAGLVDENTRVYDTTIRVLGDLRAKGLVRFAESWHQLMWTS